MHRKNLINDTGLTPEQHRLVTQNVKETYESLKGIMHHAAYQSFEAAARELRMMERAGHAMHAVNMSKLPLNPITQTPYLYDPETRILSSPTLHHGETLSFQLHLPDQGSLNHVGTHFMPDK